MVWIYSKADLLFEYANVLGEKTEDILTQHDLAHKIESCARGANPILPEPEYCTQSEPGGCRRLSFELARTEQTNLED